MDWQKFEKLSTEKQIKALEKEDHIREANRLEELYKDMEYSQKRLDLLESKGCYLDFEVDLLRAENAVIKKLAGLNAPERKIINSFIPITTVKSLMKHRKNVESLKEECKLMRQLRTELRSAFFEQNIRLVDYVKYCLDVIDWHKIYEISPEKIYNLHHINPEDVPAKALDPDFNIFTGKIERGSTENRRRDQETQKACKKEDNSRVLPWVKKPKTTEK